MDDARRIRGDAALLSLFLSDKTFNSFISGIVPLSERPHPSAATHAFKPIILLVAVWLVLHVLPVLRLEVWSQWEICAARKLLDYGFMARSGALLEPGLDAGRLAFPSDLNYTHHPHPMVWFYTVLYAIGGPWLCVTYLLSLRLAATVVLYLFLRKYFSVRSSWWATVLYVMAPAALVMDTETNIIGIAAAYWPFAAWLASRAGETGRNSLFLGIFVFFAGQTSWLFLPLLPALIWLAAPPQVSWTTLIKRPFSSHSSRAILIGGGLSLLFFLVQLVYYTPDWTVIGQYVQRQMGMAGSMAVEGTPKWKMAILVACRNAFYCGPALCLGTLAWLKTGNRGPNRRLIEASLIFFAGFALVEVALVRFCFVEVSPYTYLLAPLAVIVACTLESIKSRAYLVALVACSCVAYCYFTIRDSVPKRGVAVAPLAMTFSEATQVDQIVLTNLREFHPPFASWDNYSPDLIRKDSDRLIFFRVSNSTEFEICRIWLKRNFRNVVFAFNPEQPIDPNFLEWIRANGGKYFDRRLTIPPESPSLAVKLKLKIWDLSGRFAERAALNDTNPQDTSLEFYRMTF